MTTRLVGSTLVKGDDHGAAYAYVSSFGLTRQEGQKLDNQWLMDRCVSRRLMRRPHHNEQRTARL